MVSKLDSTVAKQGEIIAQQQKLLLRPYRK
jgi:hypothetical protein